MQKAHLNLIKYSLSSGCTISVWDGEEWEVRKCASYNAIKEAIEAVEEKSETVVVRAETVVDKVAWKDTVE